MTAVILGAFGAHALEAYFSADELETWDTAVLYQFVHSIALILTGLWATILPSPRLKIALWSFTLGILLFSGSLYLLVATGQRWLGAVAPIGGTAFVLGWVGLFLSAWHTAAPRDQND
ncbi:MAG: DUF423 domain-containing protein [Pseudomonadales bacterium]|nr:DUF423 domain-containing protein [Pseudomonadales bacterium]